MLFGITPLALMTLKIRRARPDELALLTQLAATEQANPQRHIAYLSETAPEIAAELQDLDRPWATVSAVACQDEAVVGWLVGDFDLEVGRTWWLGPFVAVDDEGVWSKVVTALHGHALDMLPEGVVEQEFAVDEHFEWLVRWGQARGFVPGTISVSMSSALDAGARVLSDAPPVEATLRPLTQGDRATVAPLHDRLFPGTYMTGAQLAAASKDHDVRLVAADPQTGVVAGYIAAQRQPDGGGYIDFLGVAEGFRRQGHARRLIQAAARVLHDTLDCRSVHLTVEASNAAARALYGSLGFKEARALRGLSKRPAPAPTGPKGAP